MGKLTNQIRWPATVGEANATERCYQPIMQIFKHTHIPVWQADNIFDRCTSSYKIISKLFNMRLVAGTMFEVFNHNTDGFCWSIDIYIHIAKGSSVHKYLSIFFSLIKNTPLSGGWEGLLFHKTCVMWKNTWIFQPKGSDHRYVM